MKTTRLFMVVLLLASVADAEMVVKAEVFNSKLCYELFAQYVQSQQAVNPQQANASSWYGTNAVQGAQCLINVKSVNEIDDQFTAAAMENARNLAAAKAEVLAAINQLPPQVVEEIKKEVEDNLKSDLKAYIDAEVERQLAIARTDPKRSALRK